MKNIKIQINGEFHFLFFNSDSNLLDQNQIKKILCKIVNKNLLILFDNFFAKIIVVRSLKILIQLILYKIERLNHLIFKIIKLLKKVRV